MIERLRRARTFVRHRYMTADPRTLGLYRWALGFLLCADCVRHWVEARAYYSNEGVLSNDFHLFRPSSGFNFSLFHAFSTPAEVHVAFALSFACYFLLMVGWRTRLFSVLSCLWVTSMDNRLVMVENGGYVVVNLMAFWGMFLPLGQRFSIDSLLRSWRERPERTLAEVDAPLALPWLTAPRVSLASLVLLVNFAIVYVFNVVNKYGDTWRSGRTVHYVLHLDRMVTGVAVFFREVLPYPATRVASWLVLTVEAFIVMLVLWPSARRWSRPLAMLLVFGLHTAFGVMMRLGPFSWFLVGWSTALLMPVHWEALQAWHARRVPAATVLLDAGAPLALWLARVLRRFDLGERLRFEPLADAPPGRMLAVRSENGRELVGAEALWRIVRALPGGRFAVPILRIASLGLAGAWLGVLERRREGIARFFGMRGSLPIAPSPHLPISPIGRKIDRVRTWVREGALAYLLVCAVSQLVNENKAIPKPFKHKQPFVMEATIQYPRIFQGWGMFAPNPIRDDGVVAVDAITIDGRHVDPFSGREPDLDLSDARGMGLNQIHQDYFNRIRLDRNKAYLKPLREYLEHWHRNTGRPEDQIVAFDVYWLRDWCPEPGTTTPYDHELIPFVSWRKPGYRPEPPLPPLPPRLKTKSADKSDKEKEKEKDQPQEEATKSAASGPAPDATP